MLSMCRRLHFPIRQLAQHISMRRFFALCRQRCYPAHEHAWGKALPRDLVRFFYACRTPLRPGRRGFNAENRAVLRAWTLRRNRPCWTKARPESRKRAMKTAPESVCA